MGARDCTRASSPKVSHRRGLTYGLQWGRAIVRAQAVRTLRDIHALRQLQWGRAIVRAQAGATRRALSPAGRGFNGGARLYARKQVRLARRDERALKASMGARDCTRESATMMSAPSAQVFRLQMGARDCTRASAADTPVGHAV